MCLCLCADVSSCAPSADTIAVSEAVNRVTLLNWPAGNVRARVGAGTLNNPKGVRLLPRGVIAVADFSNRQLCVFGADGALARTIPLATCNPHSIVACDDGNAFLVSNPSQNQVLKVTVVGGEVVERGRLRFRKPAGLTLFPDGAEHKLVVVEADGIKIYAVGAV